MVSSPSIDPLEDFLWIRPISFPYDGPFPFFAASRGKISGAFPPVAVEPESFTRHRGFGISFPV